MWVTSLRPHTGGVSLLRYALNFLVVLLAALLATIVLSADTHAADAEWDSGKIVYDERSYLRSGPVSPALARHTNIPEGSEYFVNIDDTEIPPVHRMLYFAPNTELADATSARHAVFSVVDRGTAGEEFTRIGNPAEVSLDQATYEAEGEPEVTSCVVSGIGYFICPIMMFLAEGMDKLFNVFQSLLHVSPLMFNTDSGLYKAWSVALAIANVGFAIGFLIIIYSYVTDRGVKQYDIRTILPRVIVAAILINVSYYICALAVDISNILGANLQDLFNDIRQQLVMDDDTVTDPNTWSWSVLTTVILSGGTLAAAAAAVPPGATFGGAAIHLLMPILVAAIIAIIVVVVVLAARHAIITVLIVLSPIAFTAFILPSTQKYFDRWRSIFTTMLLMYPMFSLLFGGSQLAAHLIAQNATGILTLLFAMFIQVAPLIVTPFLIKFSGSLLGRIAGMVNNPAKGLGDRAKNWSTGRMEHAKHRRLHEKNRGLMRTPGLAMAQKLDSKRRLRESHLERYKAERNAQFGMQEEAQQESVRLQRAKDLEQRATHASNALFEASKFSNESHKLEAANNILAEKEAHNNKARWENWASEVESKEGRDYHIRQGDTTAAAVGERMHELAEDHLVQESRKSFAHAAHQVEHAQNMVKNDDIKRAAAGIGGTAAEELATARATQTIRKDFNDGVGAHTELFKHFSDGLNNSELKKVALGGAAVGRDSEGNSYTFDASGQIGGALHEAAVAKYLQETNYEGAREIIKAASDGNWKGVHGTVKDIVIQKHAAGAPFLSGQSLDKIDQGLAGSGDGYDQLIVDFMKKGKFNGEKLATADAVALEDMYRIMKSVHQGTLSSGLDVPKNFKEKVDALSKEVENTMRDPLIRGKISDTNMEKLRAMKFYDRL